ncbi:MAG: response regulator [Gammaproteobacteria bacterium]|nr:response regulator [Gammaproteobacteria bacterium]MDH3410749.1 response regulator [Gammaproteobacteria bacterium]MDH3551257.1 response regulator [Gammaproteobacteria bacterium]
MTSDDEHEHIRVLIADDDENILEAYLEAFSEPESTREMQVLDALEAELFDPDAEIEKEPHFDVVACSQGNDAISLAKQAADGGEPFDVVILDVRMPPGIDGVEAGSKIRELDPDVPIVFVTGFSDVPLEELRRRVPPPMKLHYFNKPLSFTQLAQDVASMVRPQ